MNEDKVKQAGQTFNQTLHDIAFGIQKVALFKEPTVKPKIYPHDYSRRTYHNATNSLSENATFGYKDTVRRLKSELNYVVHARTQELIIGTSALDRKPKRFTKKPHLSGLPAVKFHRQLNRQQVSGKFVVEPREQIAGLTSTDTQALHTKLVGELKHKATHQYKTVWNTKGQRRSKA